MEAHIFSSFIYFLSYINVWLTSTRYVQRPMLSPTGIWKRMHRQVPAGKSSLLLSSFLSWFKLDGTCNLAAYFCAVYNNPTVAKKKKSWSPNRLGKGIWSYYWHFPSNLNNARKSLVKPATSWGRRLISAMHIASCRQHKANFLEYTAWCTINSTPVYEDDLCIPLEELLQGKLR